MSVIRDRLRNYGEKIVEEARTRNTDEEGKKAMDVVGYLAKKYPGTLSVSGKMWRYRIDEYAQPGPERTGLPFGKNRGYRTTRLGKPVTTAKYTTRDMLLKETVRKIGKMICGSTILEKKVADIIAEKGREKGLAFAIKRLGSHKRGLAKVDEILKVLEQNKRLGLGTKI